MTDKDKSYDGHRKRIKEKFLKNYHKNLDLAEYELLEIMLFYAIPRKDVKNLAKQLLANFGSVANILNTELDILKQISGVTENIITLFYIIKYTNTHILKKQISKKPILTTWGSVLDYCYIQLAYQKKEFLKILYLNNKNVLIRDDIIQEGSINCVDVDAREIVKTALNIGAVAYILVHNHPSGDNNPSKADIEVTKTLAKICGNLNIILHDHIIIGQNGVSSFKQLNLL